MPIIMELNENYSEKICYDTPQYPAYIRRGLLSQYPNHSAPNHWHDDIELIAVLSGFNSYYGGSFCCHMFLWRKCSLCSPCMRTYRSSPHDHREKGGKEMIYLQLLLSFLQIGLFSFGGGYAAMPLIQEQIVDIHGWLDMEQFTDLITISQMTPGPIAINSATFVGIRIAGISGALVASAGCILPSCVIVVLLAKLYLKYENMDVLQSVLNSLRPAVVAMIASAGISILVTAFWGNSAVIDLAKTNWSLVVIFLVSLVFLQKLKWNPILVMVLAGVMKLAVAVIQGQG